MKTLPPGLAAHLATGATTLCWCWLLTRADNASLGFTDHDRNVTFGGVTYEANAGLTMSEIKDAVGLAVPNLEVTSALSSLSLDEVDLTAGIYDDARIEIFRVNWAAPDQRVLMRAGSLGQVKRANGAFKAEVRGLAHYLQQQHGRLYQFTCDADLGDARCAVNLATPQYSGTGTIVSASSGRAFVASRLDAFASQWFTRGLLTLTSGAAAGQKIEVRDHTVAAGVVSISLWADVRQPLVAGQTFQVQAGCDKHPDTCVNKFGNIVNYRGFPVMPGNDFVTSYVIP